MIRTFAGVPGLRLLAILVLSLAGITSVQAQQTPAEQQPSGDQTQTSQSDNQQSSSSQEASPEELGRERRAKAKDYKNWTFNVGGGANMPNGTTRQFVRGGGPVAAVGVARNYEKHLGLRLDFQFDNLPLRASALQAGQATGATSHMYSLMFGPIINFSVSKNWGGYIVFGPGFYRRSGKLDSSNAIPGYGCNPFQIWWGHCYNGSLSINGNFLHMSQNEFGYNFGGGVTRTLRPNMDLYIDFRYLHGKHNGITTDTRPITIGIRF